MDSVLCKLQDLQKRVDILEQPKYNQGKMYTNCHIYMYILSDIPSGKLNQGKPY